MNVFQEKAALEESDIGTYTFKFDSEVPGSNGGTANNTSAFVKVAYANLTGSPGAVVPGAAGKTIQVDITAEHVVKLLQFGFANTSHNYQDTGILYDNVSFKKTADAVDDDEEETAACADISVLRFEDPFGNAEITCKTDTYQIPKGADFWAGFGDTKRGDQYPFYFPNGGSVTFDCQTASGTQSVYFRFEEQADSTGTLVQEKLTTATTQCTSTSASVTVNVPASNTVWNNLIMYLDTGITEGKTSADGPATVAENITVNGSETYVAPTTPTMVPALPV